MEEIILSVKKQTDINIIYNHEILKRVPRLSFTAKNEDIKSVMKRLLKNTDLVFVLNGDVMVIGPKEEVREESERFAPATGHIVDSEGKSMPHVSISVTGSSRTTISNGNGQFKIDVPEGKTLTFSYVGFKTKTQQPVFSKLMEVSMTPQENDMEEFIVTGYQKINKRLSASSTFTLKASEVKEAGVTNITAMLQGKVPGLSVINTSGSPNSVPKLRMRGTSTLIGNANPIIVVDGFVQENPDGRDPDNLMGIDPSVRDLLLSKDGLNSKAALTSNSIAGLNVNDIESITFLKDASATAIYGTNAANGVIVITTKKGSVGKLTISYDMTSGFSQKPSYKNLELMNSQERVQFSRELFEDGMVYNQLPFNFGYEGAFFDLLNRKIDETTFQKRVASFETMNTDWFDVAFRNAINTKHHMSFTGGTDKIQVYSSLFYDDSKSSAKEDAQKRIGATVKTNMELSPKLRLDIKLDLGQRMSKGYFSVNPLDYALKTSRAIPADLTYPASNLPGQSTDYRRYWLYNLNHEIEQTGSKVKSNELNSILSLNYQPIPSLTLNSSVNASITDVNSESYATERSNYITGMREYEYESVVPGSQEQLQSLIPFGGILTPHNTTSNSYTFRNTAQYARHFFEGRDQLDILAGMELNNVQNQEFTNILPGYLRDKGESFSLEPNSFYLFNPRKINNVRNSISSYASVAYSILNRYIINVNVRSDASNRFGQYSNSRFLPVWSLSGRWNIASEKWLKDSKIINQLDIKASYGFQGNVITAVGPDLILNLPESFSTVDPIAKEFIVKLKSMPYPDLKWEKTKSYNLELHTSLFNNFVDLTAAYYDKRTTDAITSRNIPLEYGIQMMYINGGNIRNHGYELNLSLNPVRSKDVTWSISTNVSKNFNSLGAGTDQSAYKIEDYLNGRVRTLDQPLNTFYVFSFKGLNPLNGLPLFNGINSSKKVPLSDFLIAAGSSEPDISGGFFTNVRYKAFHIGMSFAFSLGAKKLLNPIYQESDIDIPYPDVNSLSILSQRWRKPGDEAFTNIPGFIAQGGPAKTSHTVNVFGYSSYTPYYMFDHSDLRLVSGSFVRCQTINLSYNIGTEWLSRLKIKRATLSTSVNNLFTIADSKLGGQDPELPNIGSTALPITPIYSLGLNVSF